MLSETKPAENSQEVVTCAPCTSDVPAWILAGQFQTDRYREGQHSTLRYYRGGFYVWRNGHYVEVDPHDIRAELKQRFLGILNRDTTDEVLDALNSLPSVYVPSHVEAPCWLNSKAPAQGLVPCRNGLLDLETGQLREPSPNLFVTSALPVEYDPRASAPQFEAFLRQLWPDDEGSARTLQEWAGYLLTPDTRQQKILMLVGPPRAGKGTIARVLTALLGQKNVAGPMLTSFKSNFGLQPLIDRPLAIIADARMPGHDNTAIVERLLSISGEDALTIDRKYKAPWTGKLPTRLMVVTNKLPEFGDATLPTRFIVLRFTRSFFGNEDTDLTDKLVAELPGILNWAIEGRRRLHERGRFEQPASGAEHVRQLGRLGGPVGRFVEECCRVGSQERVSVDDLYRAFRKWCDRHDLDWMGQYVPRGDPKAAFGQSLRVAVPDVKKAPRKERRGKDRVNVNYYFGIGLLVTDPD